MPRGSRRWDPWIESGLFLSALYSLWSVISLERHFSLLLSLVANSFLIVINLVLTCLSGNMGVSCNILPFVHSLLSSPTGHFTPVTPFLGISSSGRFTHLLSRDQYSVRMSWSDGPVHNQDTGDSVLLIPWYYILSLLPCRFWYFTTRSCRTWMPGKPNKSFCMLYRRALSINQGTSSISSQSSIVRRSGTHGVSLSLPWLTSSSVM